MLLCEINMVGEEHVPFNRAFINELLSKEKKIILFVEDKHANNIKIKDVKIYTFVETKFKSYFRELLRIVILIRSFIIACKCKEQEIIFLSLHPLSQVYLSLLSHLFKKFRIKVVLHGEMESLVDLSSKFFIRRNMLKLSFLTKPKNVKYLVMGEHIKRHLILNGLVNHSDLIVFEHPYMFSDVVEKKTRTEHLILGSLGVANLAKGSEKFFSLASDFSNDNRVEFRLVGKLTDSIQPFVNEHVSYIRGSEMIPYPQYRGMMNDLDYVVFFYDKYKYQLTASGAIFDAIDIEKPIIYLNNDYFSYLVDKYNRCIGYPCDSIDEMRRKIQYLIDSKVDSEYDFIVSEIRSLKKELRDNEINIDE